MRSQMKVIISLIISSLLSPSLSTLGFDTSSWISKANWKCLDESGMKFGIVRGYENIGRVDLNVKMNLENGNEALGTGNVDVYMDPCVECGHPREQVMELIDKLTGSTYKYIYIKVAHTGWTVSRLYNQQFLTDLTAELLNLGAKIGFLTSKKNWEYQLGDTFKAPTGAYVWYIGNDKMDFTDFLEFGGFTSPHMKMYLTAQVVCEAYINRDYY